MKKMIQLILCILMSFVFFGTFYYAHAKRREDKLRLANRLLEIQKTIPVVGFATKQNPIPDTLNITDAKILEAFEIQFANKGNFYL